jgi:2-polyprenyl-6-methoxyphenol hydroxylase-like FAD-dependent oxidoreductase
MTPADRARILIVGAGPVGLASALMLADRGLEPVVLERRAALSEHPRARLVNARTMEILRRLGLEDAVREVARPAAAMRSYFGTDLLDPEPLFVPLGGNAADDALTPSPPCICSQDELEPVLLSAARERGAEVRFGAEVSALDHADDGARVTTAAGERWDGRYVLAADGARSPLRGALGIPYEGEALQEFANILFNAPLGEHLVGRESALYHCGAGTDHEGTFLTVDNRDRWLLNTAFVPAYRGADGKGDAASCTAIIRRAAGIADLPVEIVSMLTWSVMAAVAEDYQVGDVFLVGDAAHSIPPSGGFGMNTGIQDADNLAWKLAAEIDGWGGPGLLPSYAVERRPVAEANAAEALANWRAGHVDRHERDAATHGRRPEQFRNPHIVLGFGYRSGLISAEEGPERLRERPEPGGEWRPTAAPGNRAPHVWLEGEGGTSVLDLFGADFVLACADPAWVDAADELHHAGIPLRVEVVPAEAAARWAEAYGVGLDGAVLVRPDGHVAWRTAAASAVPGARLGRALAVAAGHMA